MIKLEQIERQDLPKLKKMRNELRQYFREYRLLNDLNQEDWFEGMSRDTNQVMFKVVDEVILGACGLHYISWTNRSAEFGIYIGKDYQGQGHAKVALCSLLEYGFNELNLNRIWGEVYSNNPALQFYKKFGFEIEGRLRETYYNNGWHDSYIISMLRKDHDQLLEKSN